MRPWFLSLLLFAGALPASPVSRSRLQVPLEALVPAHPGAVAGPRILQRDTTNWTNVQLNTDGTNQIHNEEQVEIHPLDPLNAVAVWRDFRLGYRRVGVGVTHDGGQTWTDFLLTGSPYAWDSDPALTVGADGTYYLVVLSLNGLYDANGIFLFRSTDGGETWVGPDTVVDEPSGTPFHDKEMVVCDANPDSPYQGHLYVTWTLFGADWTNPIVFSRSTDGGHTWSPPQQISTSSSCQWSNPAVGPEGELYVAWFDFNTWSLRIRRSTNGGASFGPEHLVQPLLHGWGQINGDVDIISYPAIDVDRSTGPYRGTVYIAYADTGATGTVDILFTRSADGGQTWTTPVRLNDDPVSSPADQFHPWLRVDENGAIHVIFYDRRNDPNNLAFDLYITHSYDGGQTWTPNERITWVSSMPIGGRAGLIGEYIGLSVRHGRTLAVWTDTRNGHQDVFAGIPDSLVAVAEPVAGNAAQPWLAVATPVFRNLLVLKLSRAGAVTVWDAQGRRRWQGWLSPGEHRIPARPWPAGVYFVNHQRVVHLP